MNLYELVVNDTEKVALDDLFFSQENKTALLQTIKEHKYLEELKKYNLKVDNKILLHGHSGCGKTTTAKAIATALNKNIVIINLSTLINAKIGETSKNVKTIFDKAIREKAVLFLDEFDQIGKSRESDDKDVAEMRRLVNTIIQLIDYFPTDSLLICATNFYNSIDTALLRRFQIKLKFEMPDQHQLNVYYDKLLADFPEHLQDILRKYDISYAEAKDYIHTTMKRQIIAELELKEQRINETII
ncbi:AAA family ATPase [Flavobacterium johnsoniae]|jgi:SpoVK/Ycf46/Vps4 family AAA+-type ATPase|uniref:AAA ATPase, central domain protein n=1 Tax=Flavobacterium johnsoniae (strain ATCC 17061 / DSM 2064 / JCM 8514 / BCRC 14874 / CCUG 350202 / NBRC 14942 / NCIMB 11054 / UW101) TaxID=376686 RepID=A5FCB4_FLAJ1|nr:ATP-binding protein [Flavobacterium johnsoniae]ABQ07151.1 AAA ATPase, central domain protein [Flavobacterium johnsoniae UW101]OXE98866.1 ATPase [Flavobacterium johnsoniae UW101]WQG81010.1 ATP-binding protein [Flavobacterium johnsoniae UW101]SHL28887.1 ATPase family associated with various cellular activities (AAA) [Flavobacterium johnsoniae]